MRRGAFAAFLRVRFFLAPFLAPPPATSIPAPKPKPGSPPPESEEVLSPEAEEGEVELSGEASLLELDSRASPGTCSVFM